VRSNAGQAFSPAKLYDSGSVATPEGDTERAVAVADSEANS
jgi:hypothetical protein